MFVELVPKLKNAGVKLLSGSDCGAYNSYVYPGISLHKELEQMVKAGLTPKEALETSTRNGARFFKMEKHYGSVDIGKTSDLIILNKNPFDDISNTQTLEYVILGNTFYDRNDLDEFLNSMKK